MDVINYRMFTAQNRTRYDPCEYKQAVTQSTNPLAYMLYPAKFESASKCRNQLGLVGGNEVSNVRGNLVDLESDLMGITRTAGRCDAVLYRPSCPMTETDCQPPSLKFTDRATGNVRTIDTRLGHQKQCQMFGYREVPAPEPMKISGCNPQRL